MLDVTQRIESIVTFKGKNNAYKLIFECAIAEDTYKPLEDLLNYVEGLYTKPSKKDFLAAIPTTPLEIVDEEYSLIIFGLAKKLREFKVG